MSEKTYPSDLTDEEWEWIKDLIPAAKSGGRPRTLCMRAVLNAIFYVTKGGIQWRMLPSNFPKWQSVYHYLRAWKRQGVWIRIGLDHGVGHFRPLSITRHRHLLTYHGTAMNHEGCVKYFDNFCHCNPLYSKYLWMFFYFNGLQES